MSLQTLIDYDAPRWQTVAATSRRQIETQMDAVVTTVNAVPLPRHPATLHLMIDKMKGLSGADFLICTEPGRALADDAAIAPEAVAAGALAALN